MLLKSRPTYLCLSYWLNWDLISFKRQILNSCLSPWHADYFSRPYPSKTNKQTYFIISINCQFPTFYLTSSFAPRASLVSTHDSWSDIPVWQQVCSCWVMLFVVQTQSIWPTGKAWMNDTVIIITLLRRNYWYFSAKTNFFCYFLTDLFYCTIVITHAAVQSKRFAISWCPPHPRHIRMDQCRAVNRVHRVPRTRTIREVQRQQSTVVA